MMIAYEGVREEQEGDTAIIYADAQHAQVACTFEGKTQRTRVRDKLVVCSVKGIGEVDGRRVTEAQPILALEMKKEIRNGKRTTYRKRCR